MFAYVLLVCLLDFCFNFCLSKFLSKSQAKQISFSQVWLLVVGCPTICFTLRHTHGWQ